MIKSDLVISNCEQVLTLRGKIPRRGAELSDLGIIEKGWISSLNGKINFIGKEKDFLKNVKELRNCTFIDCKGKVCMPGFVDPHNHLPFGGTREDEFLMRLNGKSYQEIAEAGGGIKRTVTQTREISEKKLTELCIKRLTRMLESGTTTSEAKSGYGLNFKDEIKQLRIIKKLNNVHPLDLIPTFMGAHVIPDEYKDKREEYLSLLMNKLFPEVRERNLARFFDVFCEENAFNLKETEELIKEAKKYGFLIRVHSDEFSSMGATELAIEEGAISVDHLINIKDETVDLLSKSNTTAILMPSVSFSLKLRRYAPARKLIDRGAIVALGTDFNPGSSMNCSMLFTIQLAVYEMDMKIEEAITASTVNSAYSLQEETDVGSLELNKKMDLLILDVPKYIHLVYQLGLNPVEKVVKNGKLVFDRGLVKKTN
ncbi:MAG: imidazolonepropionase [Acidobacteriota bacterium]